MRLLDALSLQEGDYVVWKHDFQDVERMPVTRDPILATGVGATRPAGKAPRHEGVGERRAHDRANPRALARRIRMDRHRRLGAVEGSAARPVTLRLRSGRAARGVRMSGGTNVGHFVLAHSGRMASLLVVRSDGEWA